MIFFLIAVSILIIFWAIGRNNNMKRWDESLKSEGINPECLIHVGSYAGGHPAIDNQIKICVIFPEKDDLVIYERDVSQYPKKKGIIPIRSINNILLEDSTTIEHKVTVGGIFLYGMYAWAMKEKEKNELAFVTIEWNNGKFNNSTIFSFDGKDAMQTANKARNQLLKLI